MTHGIGGPHEPAEQPALWPSHPSIIRPIRKPAMTTSRRCHYCNQYKPAELFVSKRKCTECASHKTCKICGQTLTLEHFSQSHGKVCKQCLKKRSAQRYIDNKEHINAQHHDYHLKNKPAAKKRNYKNRLRQRLIKRDLVLKHYDGKCACCGETEPLFLTIDHIAGNGALHRRQIGRSDMWKWLVDNEFPDGFQLLCFNCNAGKYRNGGICPHKTQQPK